MSSRPVYILYSRTDTSFRGERVVVRVYKDFGCAEQDADMSRRWWERHIAAFSKMDEWKKCDLVRKNLIDPFTIPLNYTVPEYGIMVRTFDERESVV